MEYLELYNKAKNALAEAYTVDELSAIISQTDILKHAAQVAKDDEMIINATEIKLRAERRFGEVSRELEKAKGGNEYSAKSTVLTKQKTLDSVGVSKQMANTYEKVAAVPEQTFEKALSDFRSEGEMSRAKLLKTVKKVEPKQIQTIDITPIRERPIGSTAQIVTLLNFYRLVEDLETSGEILNKLKTEVNRLEYESGCNLTKF